VEVAVEDLTAQGVVLASTNCLGNGRVDTIHDVVFLRPDVFDAKHTQAMAAELAAINHDLVKDGRRYLLIGFGRWGSSEPWLGVPVVWGQISGAGVIVEASRAGMSPDMSQGSHFFHNMIGLHVLYLSLPEGSGRSAGDRSGDTLREARAHAVSLTDRGRRPEQTRSGRTRRRDAR
jgi:hypothetical protein